MGCFWVRFLSFVINVGHHRNHIELFFILWKSFWQFFPAFQGFFWFFWSNACCYFRLLWWWKNLHREFIVTLISLHGWESRWLDIFEFNGFAVVVIIQNVCCFKSDVVPSCPQWIIFWSTFRADFALVGSQETRRSFSFKSLAWVASRPITPAECLWLAYGNVLHRNVLLWNPQVQKRIQHQTIR